MNDLRLDLDATTGTLPDASQWRVETVNYHSTLLTRAVAGAVVWGQVADPSVVAAMEADPASFVRWWNVETGAAA